LDAKELIHQSRRERQIMDILLRRGEATVAEVRAELPEAPSYSAVRALLGILGQKGRVTHTVRGRTYVYRPAVSKSALRRHALKHLVATFFGGSAEEAAAALLDLSDARLGRSARRRIARRIASARQEGR
jgi:predicted transcriptional regulator